MFVCAHVWSRHMHLLYGQKWGIYRRADANFVLLVNTFKSKGPYWVELYLTQLFELFKTLKLGNVPNFHDCSAVPSDTTPVLFPVCVIKAFLFVFALLMIISMNVSMCLSYAKFFVIFHVGTKWFVCGKPKPMTCWGLSENWPQYQDSASQRKVGFLPGFVAVTDISVMCGGAERLYTNLMAPDAFSSSENTYTLRSCCWLLKLGFDEDRKRADGLGTVSFFPALYLGKLGVKIFIVKFFYQLKLYLLICSQRPSARGSVLGLNQLSCSLSCLPLEALSALDSPIGGSQGNSRQTQLLLPIISFSVWRMAALRVLLPGHYWASPPSLSQTRSGSQFSSHPI